MARRKATYRPEMGLEMEVSIFAVLARSAKTRLMCADLTCEFTLTE